MTSRECRVGATGSGAAAAGALTPAARGKSAIKPAATTSGDKLAVAPFGNDAMSEVSRSIACSPGMRARLTASFQGSTSSRANAETTLSNGPFRSSPIDANKKSSNSRPRRGVSAAWVMSSAKSLVARVYVNKAGNGQAERRLAPSCAAPTLDDCSEPRRRAGAELEVTRTSTSMPSRASVFPA